MTGEYVRLDRVATILRRRGDRGERSEIDDIIDEIGEETLTEDEVLRSVAAHRDQLEGELEDAVNELRLIAGQLQDAVENPPGDDDA